MQSPAYVYVLTLAPHRMKAINVGRGWGVEENKIKYHFPNHRTTYIPLYTFGTATTTTKKISLRSFKAHKTFIL